MLELGELYSWIKDFFDTWTLCRTFEFDGEQLRASILATCQRRETPMPTHKPLVLTTAFAEVPGKRAQRKSFVRKARGDASDLEEVIELLAVFLWLPTRGGDDDEHFAHQWPPGGPWR